MSFDGLTFCSSETMSKKETPLTQHHVYCVLCFTKFTTKQPEFIPRNLKCAHYFCTGCLLNLQEYQGGVLECPTCKLHTILPQDGNVLGLDKNFDVLLAAMETSKEDHQLCNFCIRKLVYPPRVVTLNCFDCGVLFCGVCCDEIHKQLEFRNHNVCLATADVGELKLSRPSSSNNTTLNGYNGRTILNQYNSLDSIPECDEHKEKLKMYCNNCKIACCTFCLQNETKHKGHKSVHIHEAEDLDKRHLFRLQQKLDDYAEKYIKSRSDVQKAIEAVKKNDVHVKDLIRRYFRDLKTAIDTSEAGLIEEFSKRNNTTLRCLNEQLSSMIEISSKAKSASRQCDSILNLSYFDLVEVKRQVEHDIEQVLNLQCKTTPCVGPLQLQCQFPNHEMLLNQLLTCAKIVSVPEAPVNLSCHMVNESFITVMWSMAACNSYTYPTKEYILQSDTGQNNTFVDIYKGSLTEVLVNSDNGKVMSNTKCEPPFAGMNKLCHRMQYRVAAINIIGQSAWSLPYAITLPCVQN